MSAEHSHDRCEKAFTSHIYLWLDIEKTLIKQQKQSYISEREKEVIKYAINFLEVAEQGRKIIQEGPLVADIPTVRHYTFISKVLPTIGVHSREIKKAIQDHKEVLQNIAEGSSSTIPQEKFQKTQQLFRALSNFSLNEFTAASRDDIDDDD